MRAFYDVVVVGAGSAGAASARALARGGWSVLLIDKRAAGEAGARWVNAVPRWMFERADVAPPSGDEERSHGGRYVLCEPSGAHRVVVSRCPTTFFDMRSLVARLQSDAVAAGAELEGGCVVDAVVFSPGRQTLRLRGREGLVTVDCRLVVDASGFGGAVRSRVPVLAAACDPIADKDLCLAAQEVRSIADVDGARSFLRREGLQSGEQLAYVGVAGGYSTRLMQVDLERGEVDILGGAIKGVGSGLQLVKDVVDAHPWIGARLFGGSSVIPLRRPYDLLGVAGVALVGDAASMVFPAHGSGVGAGLVAARMLADVVAEVGDPGSADVARRYGRVFHREIGALFVAYDAFRRASQLLQADDITELVRAGFMNEASTHDALAQRMPRFSAASSKALAQAALRAPGLAKTMGPTVARMLASWAVSRAHPATRRRGALVGRGLDHLIGAR